MNRLLALFFASLAFTSLAVLPGAARAEFPSKPITLIVPYAAGGSNDTLSRILAEHMSKTLGRPIIINTSPVLQAPLRLHALLVRLRMGTQSSWATWERTAPPQRSIPTLNTIQ